MKKIPRYNPVRADEHLQEPIRKAIEEVLAEGDFINGDAVQRVSDRASRMFLRGRPTLPCGNGTDALALVYKAAQRKYGAENARGVVIVPTMTFVATASAVSLAGMQPVISSQWAHDPFTIDLDDLRRRLDLIAVGGKTVVAFTIVHLYGRVTRVPDGVLEVLEERKIALVEDACQAFGGWVMDRDGTQMPAGTQGFGAAFSFFPSKPLGCYGDGGMCVFADEGDRDYARMLARHGATPEDKYNSVIEGQNSRLDSIQAAILDVKLIACEAARSGRRRIAERYNTAFEKHIAEHLVLPELDQGHAVHCYTIMVKQERRDSLIDELHSKGIDAAVVYPRPLHEQPAFESAARTGRHFDEASLTSRRVVSLPCWDGMTGKEVDRVIEAVIDHFSQ